MIKFIQYCHDFTLKYYNCIMLYYENWHEINERKSLKQTLIQLQLIYGGLAYKFKIIVGKPYLVIDSERYSNIIKTDIIWDCKPNHDL